MTRLDAPPIPAAETATHGLGRDTELLSAALNDVLEEQAGRVFASRLQWLFRTAEVVRGGDAAAAARLVAYLEGVPDDSVEPIIRACSLELQLANIAEERERVRRRRQYDATGAIQRESLAETARILRSNEADIPALVAQLQIEHVLTAHPTEATRRSVLDHQWDVAALLDKLDDPRTGVSSRRRLLDQLRETLTIWWQTDEVRRVRPRVEDEVRRNLFFIEAVLFDAVPAALEEMERALDTRLVQPVLSYGSWTGGDMDGHPEVGADTLAGALALHRASALRLLRERVDRLARAFSHSSLRIPLSEELAASLENDERELPSAEVLRRAHREWEPLRTKLGFIRHRLVNTGRPRGREPGYADAQQLRRDLEMVLAHLGSRHVALGSIRRLLWQVDVFGFHLAGIDIRQGATVVRQAASSLLPGFADADEPRRMALLTEALASGRRGIEHDPGGEAGELLRVLDTVALAGEAYGPQAVPAMVISMTEQPSDVLAACWLAARAGATSLRMVPLFETRGDLDAAPGTMGVLYDNEAYRNHLRAHANRQTVMVGYSDSGKDSGYVASQYSLYVAQERLSAQAGDAGVVLELFHGRGGSPSRGGGRTYRAILAQPEGSVQGRIRITEQGETVSARYSDPELAVRSLEQTVSAVLLATALPNPPIRPEWRAEMDRLSERSRERYRGLVYDDPDFERFFAQIAPIAELSELNIGSRPPSRNRRRGVEALRAIPWVFAWTQNRLLLPSWYGAGAALDDGDLDCQREMWRDWPFFRGLIGTLEMALFKTDLGVAERYLRLVDDDLVERFWPGMREEYDLVVERVLAITGQSGLLDETPALQRRLEHRNPWVDPLSHLQVELLGRLRAGRDDARTPLLATITGIAAGMRNTG
ncbi:phosphoenolpyruvate carboxylase [Candidatus Solirubrobacter pratensis]|uniref:phosphoenolpyruvate carboxylase n=1 Tax=Candidatus Solirubrobacter pratensis TaxID=1298857 RepID=UPI000421F6EF|nr:phosphoenolpyruvate carboxylase [Candidatus Solirubrobacter pratensis]